MFPIHPHIELRLANDRHRERIAAAALRRSVPRGRTRRHGSTAPDLVPRSVWRRAQTAEALPRTWTRTARPDAGGVPCASGCRCSVVGAA